MKPLIASLALALAVCTVTPAFAQETEPPPPPVAGEYAPPAAPDVAAQGEWVLTDSYGWIWVPADAQTVVVQNRPYAYFYTPSYGWTWYVAPWGGGHYYRGDWVHVRLAPHVYYGGRWVGPRHFAAPAHRVAVSPPVRHVAPAHRAVVHRGRR